MSYNAVGLSQRSLTYKAIIVVPSVVSKMRRNSKLSITLFASAMIVSALMCARVCATSQNGNGCLVLWMADGEGQHRCHTVA